MRILLIFALLCIAGMNAYADDTSSLMLTDSEVQKLKSHFHSDETQALIWKGDPISIELPIGKEKRVVFPNNIIFDAKGALTTDQLRVVNNDKSVYLTALSEFDTTRVYATSQSDGKVILIDLKPSTRANSETQKIIVPVENQQIDDTEATERTSSIDNDAISEKQTSSDVTYVSLLRYAWQQVYAPESLREGENLYSRSPMHTESLISYLIYGDKVIAHPIGSWQARGTYVTAVLLQNKYNHPASINLARDICGSWEAAVIYPRTFLKPSGQVSADNTTLFLVSKRPFSQTLGVCHGDA